ncbi:MAG: (2Fe-2S) ferredoxin domain-containing protein [Pseudomonadales bacterium]|nr:(2Fe-2S) ferredoxin domain-containing protein [Pseudomonadales bacterium]
MTTRLIACVNFRPFSGQPSCAGRGSKELIAWLEAEIARREIDVSVERIVCMGHCPHGPNFRVWGGEFVHHADEEKLGELLDRIERGEVTTP